MLVGAVVVVAVGIVQVAYWGAVAETMEQNVRDCGLWRSTPPGRLLPWPKPSGLLTMIGGPMTPWDGVVCDAYVSGAFVFVAPGVSIGSGSFGWGVLDWLRPRRQGLTENPRSP